jgi:hypothetical protein
MIRLLPCARLASAQTDQSAVGGLNNNNMCFAYIAYPIYQLSPILALRHNAWVVVLCLASSPDQA